MRRYWLVAAAALVVVIVIATAVVFRVADSFVGASDDAVLVPAQEPVAVWVTDGEVDDLVQVGGKAYAAGDFTRVSSWTGGLARTDASSGATVDNLPWIAGSVNVLVSDGSGGWYVGGTFDRAEGGGCPNLIRIRASGTLDSSFCPRVDVVEELALAGGRLYVGADCCSEFGPEELVALDPATGKSLPWKLEAEGGYHANDGIGRDDVDPSFRALASDGETLYLGGFFDSLDGQPRAHLAAIDGRTGELLPWSPEVEGDGDPFPITSVGALALTHGVLYAGGLFTRIDGEARPSLASFDIASASLSAWAPDAPAMNDGGVLAIAAGASGVAVATGPGVGGSDILRYGNPAGQAPRWTRRLDTRADAIVLDDRGRLALVGGFSDVGQATRPNAAMLTADGRLTSWNPAPTNGARTVAFADDGVILGGEFNGLGGAPRDGLAAFDARTGELLPWAPTVEQVTYREEDEGSIPSYALAANEELLYVFGDFDGVNGASRNRLAAFRLVDGQLEQWSPDVFPRVPISAQMTADEDAVYVGHVTYIGGTDFTGSVVALNHDGDVVWQTPPSFYIEANSLVRYEDELWVGGDSDLYLVAFDAETGEQSGVELPTLATEEFDEPALDELATDGDVVYLNGAFEEIGGEPRPGVAAMRGRSLTDWRPVVGSEGYVDASPGIAVAGSTVYFSGDFDSVSGKPRAGLAAVSADMAALIQWPAPGLGISGAPEAGNDAVLVNGAYLDTRAVVIFPLSAGARS